MPLLATDAIQMGADEMRTDIRKVQRQFQGADGGKDGSLFEKMTEQMAKMTAMLKMMEEASKKDVPAKEVGSGSGDA